MKKIFILYFGMVLSISFVSAQHSNCPVSPYPNTITQPDGSSLTLLAYGNEAVNYLETNEGYTVLKNSDGVYEYAITGLDGNLTLSGIKASDETKIYGKTEMQKHLRYGKQQIALLMQYHQSMEEQTTYGKAGANVFPPSGNRKLVVILIEYPDLPATIAKSNFELLFNQTKFNGTGSFKDYYLKNSDGKLNITTDVYGWFKATSGYKYYKTAATQLLSRALFCADSAGVDFSQYDSDNDGYVDAVMILHSGIGGEESSAPNAADYIWSFRASWGGSPTYDTKKISAYAMFPERRYSTAEIVGIGVIVHEFGHILDLPDLYATNYNNTGGGPEGIGNYGTMGGGGWLNFEHTPCMHDAWTKIQMGWLTPTMLTAAGRYTIPKGSIDSNFAFQINTSRSNEFFLLESRLKKGQDYFLPSKGLAIWHANSAMAGKLSVRGNNANNDTSNLGLGLIQADGDRDLEWGNNRGDAGDLFPGSTDNKYANPYTMPNTNLYYKVGGIKVNSSIYIHKITLNPDSSISFKFGAVPDAYFKTSNPVGCAPFTVSFTNNSFFASTFLWNFGDGTTSTTSDANHTFTTPGNYNVWLTITDSTGKLADSIMQTIQVLALPDASFTFLRDANVITLKNTSTAATNYTWKLGTFSTSQSNPDPIDLTLLKDSGIVHIRLFASNACASDSFDVDIDIWKTGINDVVSNALKIAVYPNPVQNDASLSFATEKTEKITIELFNILGEKISTIDDRELQPGIHRYDIAKELFYSKGIYIVRISSATLSGYARIVFQ